MSVAAARRLRDGTVCFVGIGLPSRAANLARSTHAPKCVLIYESGTIGAKPHHLPLSIGDGELAETADAVVSVPEIFSYWLQAGRIDVGFLGAAQIDRHGNLNSTVIGPYDHPKVRLPGAGGAPEIAASCGETIVMLRQTPRTFVERARLPLDRRAGRRARARASALGLRGAGVTVVVTDLGVLEPDPETRELTLTSLHPGVTAEQAREATAWPLRCADDLGRQRPAHRRRAGGAARAQVRDRRGRCRMSEPAPELQRIDDDERATRDADPAYLSPDYVGTRLRAPRRPLLLLPQTLSELTGPAFGHDDVRESDSDLTTAARGRAAGRAHHRQRPRARRATAGPSATR